MKVKHMVLEISQDDLDIITAAIPDRRGSCLSDVSARILDDCIKVSGTYTRLPVRITFSGVGRMRVSGGNVVAVDIEDAVLGSLIHVPTKWVSRVLSSFLKRFAVQGGVRAVGSSLLLELTRLKLPIPLSLTELTLREIRIRRGLIQIMLV